MNPELIGKISGFLVFASVVPYAIRVYQGKISPNLTTWSLWSLIGLALLVTYKGSGAGSNVWPAVFGFTNPLLITFLALKQQDCWPKPTRFEKHCIWLCLASLSLWFVFHNKRELVQFGLYLAIIADLFAALPLFPYLIKNPDHDRPFAWALFAIGYGLSVFAVTDRTFSNYALPIYMAIGSIYITFILSRHRLERRAPIHDWF